MTSLPASERPASLIDDPSPSVGPFVQKRDPLDDSLAALCVVGTPVSEALVASIGALEDALQKARTAHEGAEQRLRLQRDRVDDDLVAALAACRDLEEEKLSALGIRKQDDAELFLDAPSAPADSLTLASLRENHAAQIGALTSDFATQLQNQRLELSKQYFAEVQDLATASARSMEDQAQQFRERVAEGEALRHEGEALRQQNATLMSDLHVTRSELAAAQTRIHMLLSSASWRAGRPLRGAGRVLRWISGR